VRRRASRIGALIVGLALLGGGFGAAWLMEVDKDLDRPMSLPAPGAILLVERGDTLRSIARDIARRGWIKTPLHLALLGRWTGEAQRIKTGEFRIAAGTSPRGLLAQLVAGEVVQHAVTLVEGWTFARSLLAIRAHPAITKTLSAGATPDTLSRFGLQEGPVEGQLLPDTYHFTRGTADVEIVRRAYRAMEAYLHRAWQKRDQGLPLTTPYEALILASIVEKETGQAEERPRIAGVFVRRLKAKMRLETDPTVIYGLGEEFDGNLTRRHLRRPTPYNTYVIKGLTPTPIALPGRAAIEAVLHPQEGDALFFVSRGDGFHHFSSTFAEHQRAVDKYQRRRRPRGG